MSTRRSFPFTGSFTAPEPARPERLSGPRPVMPDGYAFTWGPVDDIYEIPGGVVVEFRIDQSNNITPRSWAEHGQTRFIAYIGAWAPRAYETLADATAAAGADRDANCGDPYSGIGCVDPDCTHRPPWPSEED